MNIPWHSTNRQLRQFAVLCMLLSAVLLLRWSSREFSIPGFLASVLVLVGIIGFFRPSSVRPVYVGWMIAVSPIGWIVIKLILAALFYGVFTPIGLCFRLLGRDTLDLKLQPGRESYWIRKKTPDDPLRYLQQF